MVVGCHAQREAVVTAKYINRYTQENSVAIFAQKGSTPRWPPHVAQSVASCYSFHVLSYYYYI